MKLILTSEVDGLGSAGDVVDVKDGYGRNYLLPRGVAMRWTRGSERQAESIRAAVAARGVRDHDHAEQVKASLEQAPVDLKVRSGQGGRLFGAVTPGDIAEALGTVAGENVDKRTIVLGHPIKSLGAHTVDVRLVDDLTAKVTLNVIPA